MVYIPRFEKNIWPGYIPVKKNELFSSWYFRLAAEHKSKVHTFTKQFLGNLPMWNRDIDKSGYEKINPLIASHSPLSDIQIKEMFLNTYEGIVFEEVNITGNSIGILPLGIRHRQRFLYGLLYCPSCLRNDGYYKTEWRLLSSIICVDCNEFLIDGCPFCDKPIIFHRLELGHKNELLEIPINICHHCHNDLTKLKENRNRPLTKHVKYQISINKMIKTGITPMSQYSFLYFRMLFYMCTLATTTSEKWIKIRNAYSGTFGEEKLIYNHEIYPFRRIIDRREVIVNCHSILVLDELNLTNFINQYKINFSDFSKDMDPVPFWFERIIKQAN